MNDHGSHLVVEFFDGEPAEFEGFAGEFPDEVTVLRRAGFNAADPTTTELLVAISPLVIKQLGAIVRTHIEARKHVSIKVDGIEMTGLGKKDALEVLDRLAEREEN